MNLSLFTRLILMLTATLVPKSLGATKTLLLDSTLIEHTDNIRIVVGQVEKSAANPLFGEDSPWEPRFDNMYPNVIWDEEARLFKCWYNPFLVEVEDWIGSNPVRMRWLYRQSGLCYATSNDGIHWVKPSLDLLPYQGQTSNILLRDVHGVGVFRDDYERNPARTYKMFYVNEKYGRRTTVAVRFSPDGLHWDEPIVMENFSIWADTHNNAFWAPTLQRYVTITRDWDFQNPGPIDRVRLVSRTESTDFVHWSDPQVVLRGLDDNLQIYAMPVFYYGGVYLGLPAIFNISEDRVHVELAWSKDTMEWHRIEPGTPLIPNSENKGDYDWGCVYAAASPIFGNEGISLYYGGSDGPHYGERQGCLALATLRLDGFAAATPADPSRKGTIVSVPRNMVEGIPLRVTADTESESGGTVQVALLDHDNREIAQSTVMTGSFSSRPVVWQHAPPEGIGPVRIKFTLTRARLYSYETPGR